MDIPTEADWRSEVWCLDCESAYKRFAGKTRDEAVAMFADNALLYQEAVMLCPIVASASTPSPTRTT